MKLVESKIVYNCVVFGGGYDHLEMSLCGINKISCALNNQSIIF